MFLLACRKKGGAASPLGHHLRTVQGSRSQREIPTALSDLGPVWEQVPQGSVDLPAEVSVGLGSLLELQSREFHWPRFPPPLYFSLNVPIA